MKQTLYDFKNPQINSLVLNLTFDCNLACDYCYADFEEKKKELMSIELITKIISSYAKFADSHGSKYLYLIWHGGEPLQVGKDYFRKIMAAEKVFLDKGYKICNGIQTNGTLVDEKWISFFKENHFWVGISLDGPKEVNDAHRHYRGGLSSFSKTCRAVDLLLKNKVDLDIIAVLNEESKNRIKEIFDFFNGLNIQNIDFIPRFYYDDKRTLTPERYSEMMIELFDLWVESGKKLKIRFLNDLLKKVTGTCDKNGCMYLECELVGQCGENLAIFPNGDIYPCDCLIPLPELRLGNIKETELSELHRTQSFSTFKEKFNSIDQDCFSCEVFGICKGGCLNRRLSPNSRDFYCESRKRIISHLLAKTWNKSKYR